MLNRVKPAKSSAVIGFMEFTQCPYCVEFRKTWEVLKEKNKSKKISFVEINKDSLIEDVSNFNNEYKKCINPPLLTTNVETYPEIFYVINKNIKYYDKTADRSETTMQNLINTVIKTNTNTNTNTNIRCGNKSKKYYNKKNKSKYNHNKTKNKRKNTQKKN